MKAGIIKDVEAIARAAYTEGEKKGVRRGLGKAAALVERHEQEWAAKTGGDGYGDLNWAAVDEALERECERIKDEIRALVGAEAASS